MATRGLGASGLKISSLNLGSERLRFRTLQPLNGFQLRIPKYIQYDGLEISARPKRAFAGCHCSVSEANSNLDDSPEDIRPASRVSKLIPNSFEVESLVTDICDTTSIAEFELKLGGFQLYVMRDLTAPNTTMATPVSAPISANTGVDVPNANGSASSTSLAIYKSKHSPTDVQTLPVKAVDEGLAILQSPRVGFFRRSRTIKGKRAPPSCKEKQQVKEGQVLCYIEQLGGEIPIESDISGEVIKILQEDGDPVGYGDALIAILPSFPGIKKL
ncbi:hypothetical protein ACH5RR_024577 [Cinchona calisaya]|uniref:Lipoyl-binding domain-containing protein n=1 Tax=Cinchona calisaya TaxID=153742 RepID=A0ABD2Z0H9_9GENT